MVVFLIESTLHNKIRFWCSKNCQCQLDQQHRESIISKGIHGTLFWSSLRLGKIFAKSHIKAFYCQKVEGSVEVLWFNSKNMQKKKECLKFVECLYHSAYYCYCKDIFVGILPWFFFSSYYPLNLMFPTLCKEACTVSWHAFGNWDIFSAPSFSTSYKIIRPKLWVLRIDLKYINNELYIINELIKSKWVPKRRPRLPKRRPLTVCSKSTHVMLSCNS